jgi:predicted MFS family arabinose efflux permease
VTRNAAPRAETLSSAETASSAATLTALLCLAEVLSMLGTSSFPALLPEFQRDWGLSNTEAGWISGIFFAGYVAAVPPLVGVTDRSDPRRIYLLSFIITAASTLAYALLAQGFWSALALRALAGVGLAGGYMPGLKLLTDRVGGPRQGRYVAFYTGGFSLGTALSFAFTGEAAAWFGWRIAFAAAAAGAVIALVLVLLLVPGGTAAPSPESERRAALDFRPVFRNRAAMAFILGYSGHTWELFALRSWLVAFLVQSARFAGDPKGIAAASWLTTVIVLLSTAASIYGAEVATRADRRRIIGRIMLLSAAIAVVTGLSAGAPVALVAALCLLYHMAVMGDSAALTGGAVAAAAPGQRGATLAVHSVLGFGAAFIGPLAVGFVLDLAGGEGSRLAWLCAFIAMGAGSAAAFAAIRRL